MSQIAISLKHNIAIYTCFSQITECIQIKAFINMDARITRYRHRTSKTIATDRCRPELLNVNRIIQVSTVHRAQISARRRGKTNYTRLDLETVHNTHAQCVQQLKALLAT